MAKKKPTPATEPTLQQQLSRGLALVTSRPKWLAAITLVVVVALVGDRLWRGAREYLAGLPQYRLTADAIVVSPPPAWVRGDVKAEVLRNSGLLADVSVLADPAQIHARLVDAFELHPWVRHVERVELVAPAGAEVTLVYRQPVATIEAVREGVTELLPVDAEAVRLPDADLTPIEKQYLPRIVGIDGQVMIGEPWTDPRVLGGVNLALALTPAWNELYLVDILPSEYPQVRRSQRFYEYDLRASYGTVIHWGAAPGMGPADEHPFEAKLTRLRDFILRQGPLNTIATPKSIDVRQGLVVEQRTAKLPNDKTPTR